MKLEKYFIYNEEFDCPDENLSNNAVFNVGSENVINLYGSE